jgi:hypothetical protein
MPVPDGQPLRQPAPPRARVNRRPTTPGTAAGTDPAHDVGGDGRTFLQARLTRYAGLVLLIYLSYWPAFYLIWSRDPRFGPAVALGHIFHWAAWALGLAHLGMYLLCRVRAWSVPLLVAGDVVYHAAVGVTFAAIVRHHPHPLVALLEGLLALAAVMAIRALLVPSSAGRTALVGGLMCAASTLMVLVNRPHFSQVGLAFATLVFIFVNWSLIMIVLTVYASWVLYGLRREVQQARRFGQYTLLEKLGEGGMGVVYRAQHAMLRRPTAIKLLNGTHQQTSLARFEREVQLMAELTHANTVTVHDYGRTADGVFYYAMEYLDGVDLELLVELDGPQSPARVIHLLRQTCGALAEAHARGLIHRDIKPANVFLCRERGEPDVVKVLDFGVVKELQGTDASSAGDRMPVGTPLYMSPESMSSPDQLDARSDLYSLGAVGYFLLCGQPVFRDGNVLEICAAHLHAQPELPSARLARPLPGDLEALIMRCLAKSPGERPASAGALAEALAACSDGQGWSGEQARRWWSTIEARIQSRRAARTGARDAAANATVAVDGRDRG